MTSRRTRARLIQQLRNMGIVDKRVLRVLEDTPRHIFLDEALAHRAYENTALPIGYNQTLSQPYIVAKMSELIMQNEPRRVLEIGTGSGYQAAILAQLVCEVYSVERIQPLQNKARERFQLLGLNNIWLRHADGGMGWPEMAPFHAIMVTAAPDKVPDGLLSQLADGGRLVIPVGNGVQKLMVITRQGQAYSQRVVENVNFVPLVAGTVA
ncbi:MAG: protein-L-isoaspartate O-methyltransferase [Gammaproteobacteria bacterium]|nr:MAG: protein-L-isoaspartate O-methyltransferase [Gammaproteobacteria bacterium]